MTCRRAVQLLSLFACTSEGMSCQVDEDLTLYCLFYSNFEVKLSPSLITLYLGLRIRRTRFSRFSKIKITEKLTYFPPHLFRYDVLLFSTVIPIESSTIDGICRLPQVHVTNF